MHSARFDWVGPGTVIAGRYRVESLLGEGGYGAVYVATQTNLGRKVALKLLHPEVLARGRARERFEREAQLTQQLTHPNVVRLFEAGVTEQGMPYMICELLEGRSVEDEIRRVGALPPARVVHITQQMLKGLAEAHQRGIIHRDIKPANVFLCDYAGEPDFVKVLDFGIAAGPPSDKAAGLTQEGISLGTPAYMSPEQVLDEPLDGRADLYAVGLVMAEMLQGVAVYRGTGAMEVALQQISQPQVPLQPVVTQGPLGQFIVRATQKERSMRFANALEMLDAIRKLPLAAGFAPGFVDPMARHGVVMHSGPMPGPMPGPMSGPQYTTFPSGSAVSVALASPRPGAAKKPPYGLLIGAAVVATLAVCLVAGAVLLKMVGGSDRKSGDDTVETVVVAAPPRAPGTGIEDPEELVNRMLQEQLSTAFRGMMDAQGGGTPMPCKPLPPAATTFAVESLTLPVVVGRFEAAGYVCQAFLPMGHELATMVFSNANGVTFNLFYGSGTHIEQMNAIPNTVRMTDVKTHRSMVIVPGDNNPQTALKVGKVMQGQPP